MHVRLKAQTTLGWLSGGTELLARPLPIQDGSLAPFPSAAWNVYILYRHHVLLAFVRPKRTLFAQNKFLLIMHGAARGDHRSVTK